MAMAVWILTQMKRWGYVKGDMDYQKVASQVFLADQCREVMKSLGYKTPEKKVASALARRHHRRAGVRAFSEPHHPLPR